MYTLYGGASRARTVGQGSPGSDETTAGQLPARDLRDTSPVRALLVPRTRSRVVVGLLLDEGQELAVECDDDALLARLAGCRADIAFAAVGWQESPPELRPGVGGAGEGVQARAEGVNSAGEGGHSKSRLPT